MKATGIVRRIDDLGRVVIPKEIRRTMRIREGDPLEIYTEKDGEVIFKKYSPIGELGDFAANYVETLAKASGHGACITDRDNVIAVSGLPKKELIEKPVSSELENVMNEKIVVSYKDGKPVSVADGVEKNLSERARTPGSFNTFIILTSFTDIIAQNINDLQCLVIACMRFFLYDCNRKRKGA